MNDAGSPNRRALAVVTGLLALVALASLRSSPDAVENDAGVTLVATGASEVIARGDCLTPAEHALVASLQTKRTEQAGILAEGGGPSQKYRFDPHGGLVGQDLWLTNYVDLDPGSGVLDWDCTDFTYDGHRGHDSVIASFVEQAIGVPVFAALDGEVIETHDGEPDTNTSCTGIGNHVILDHGGTQQTYYWHFKTGSVAVAVGQYVTAGTYLGDTGSSGCSTYPHLHFGSYYGGTYFEPNTGPCHAGTSTWMSQEPVVRRYVVSDFAFSNTDFSGWVLANGFPNRTGYTLTGQHALYFAWVQHNLPASSTWRVTFRKPDGTVAYQSSVGSFGNASIVRWGGWWHSWTINFSVPGTWHVELEVNGVSAIDAPLEVVTSAGQMVNRPPNALDGVSLDPPAPRDDDAIQCRVATSLVNEDPDYDVVSYHYVWTIDGQVARDVTHAGHADMLPKGAAAAGTTVECRVTPTDGSLQGATSAVSAAIASSSAEVCNGGTTIRKATLSMSQLGATPGDEGFTFSGKLEFGPGQPAGFSPLDALARGAQILVEDLGSGGSVVYELSHRTTPVPPGAETATCDLRKKDGWKVNSRQTTYAYANRSGRLGTEGCADGSASGLKLLKWSDKRSSGTPAIDVTIKVAKTALPTPVGPLRATVVLGADASAGASGACGSVTFAACGRNATGTSFLCR